MARTLGYREAFDRLGLTGPYDPKQRLDGGTPGPGRARGEGRRPRLRVVGEARARPRHALRFSHLGRDYVAEFWTPAEWAALAEWERPRRDTWGELPGGAGFLAFVGVTLEEAEEVDELARRWGAMAAHRNGGGRS